MESLTPATNVSGLVGQHLGPYEIVDQIGRGGMAVVYKALQPTLRRHVAIKVLPPYLLHEEGFLVRFQQEAETVAQLQHPNILPVYDYGQTDGSSYIIMPLVSGGTLRDWLSEGVTLERALLVFSRILSALEHAHTRQPAIVHRDIKPSNILMNQGDWPLLADFGIAKILEPSAHVTRTGMMVGTPEYMAPEQSEGRAVDHRADLYAMGVMLFELLTGQLPFQGDTPVAVILQHIRAEPPAPHSINPDASPVWEAVIRRSLAKNPGDRYPSALAMDEAVQAAWRVVQRESGAWRLRAQGDAGELYHSAARALEAGEWQRVVTLCGQLLEIDPAHSEAVQLLTEAHEALRREHADRTTRRPAPAPAADAPVVDGDPARAAVGMDSRPDSAALRADPAAAAIEQARAAQLAGWYDDGAAAFARQDWDEAAGAFEQIVAEAPGYRDALAQLASAEQQRAIAQGLASARDSLMAGLVPEAIALLESLQRAAPESAEVRTLLAQARAKADSPRTVARSATASPPVTGESPTAIRGAPSADPSTGATIARDADLGADPVGPRTPLPASSPPVPAPAPAPAPMPVAASAPPVPAAEPEPPPIPAPPRPPPGVTPIPAGARAAAAPHVSAAPELAPPAGSSRLPLLALAGGLAVLIALAFLGFQALNAQRESAAEARPTAGATAGAAPAPATAAPTATPAPTAADFFPRCEAAVNAGEWAEATPACERVRAMEPEFPGVAGALAATYVGLGKDQLAQGAPAAAVLEVFDKAVAAKADDADAVRERERLLAYRDGDAALAAESWSVAVEKLEDVFNEAPGYAVAGNSVKSKLATALVGWGEALLAAREYRGAQQRCEQALRVEAGTESAAKCRAEAIAALTPPTARPQAPAAAPAPQTQPQAPAPQPKPQAPAAAPAQPAPQAPRPQTQPQAPAAPPPAAPVPTRPPVQAPPAPPTRPAY